MPSTYGINVPSQRVEECRTVEVGSRFSQMRLFLSRTSHFRQSCQRFCHATHLAGYIHIPHFIAVARLGTPFLHATVTFGVCTVVQSVPYPQPHVLGSHQRLLCCCLVVDAGSYVNQPCQLFMYGVVWSPHPMFVVVRPVHLYQYAMLGRYGVQVAVAIPPEVLLITVEVAPRPLHLFQLLFWGQVAGFPIASQLLVPYECTLLALAQPVHHLDDVFAEPCLLLRVLAAGKCHSHRRHIVA